MADELSSGGDRGDINLAPAAESPAPAEAAVSHDPSPPTTLPMAVPQPGPRLNLVSLFLAAVVVVAVWLPLQFWRLDATPFHTKGEPREALMVQSIVRDGQWILPRRNVTEMPAKPPLFHWLGALVAHARGGLDEGAVRIPSALCSVAAALVVLVTGAIAWSAMAGLAAALALLTSFEWLRAATSARVDMTLTFGLTLAMCGLLVLHQRGGGLARWAIALGSAWAVLSKGPVGLALPLLLVVAMTVVDRSLTLIRALRPIRIVLFVGVVAALWYGLAFMEGGSDFIQKQVFTENVWRFVGTARFTEGHRHSVFYLFGVLLAGLLPWTLLCPSVAAALWRTRRMTGRHDPQTFLLVWIVIVFGFYSIASSKRGVYLLALYPALFLLLGWWLHTARESVMGRRRLARALSPIAWALAWLCGAVAVFAALAHIGLPVPNAIPDLLGARARRDALPVVQALSIHSYPTMLLFGLAAAAAAGAALSASRQQWGLLLACLVVSTATLGIAVRQIVMPAVGQAVSRRPFNDAVRRIVGPDGSLSAYRSFDYGSVFDWERAVPVYDEPLSASGPPILIAGEETWARATPMERRYYRRVPFVESPRGGNIGRLVVLQRQPSLESQQ